ncbi:helix-turn-helix domain-containing protein [Mucisphaera sp.]|uniref:helix-turn-helix domain-containing protein n=1 Tax=Mucisphaera sp. TaxID=2913024 RepID=UPI003D0D204C
MSLLAETLQNLIDRQRTSVSEIGELAGVSPSTVYRWLGGQSRPDFDSIRLLLRHLPSKDAQEALLSVFAGGTQWQFLRVDQELDYNQDGRVDVKDAVDAAIASVRDAADTLARLSTSGTELPPNEEVVAVVARLQAVVGSCTIAQRVLTELADQRARSRPGG